MAVSEPCIILNLFYRIYGDSYTPHSYKKCEYCSFLVCQKMISCGESLLENQSREVSTMENNNNYNNKIITAKIMLLRYTWFNDARFMYQLSKHVTLHREISWYPKKKKCSRDTQRPGFFSEENKSLTKDIAFFKSCCFTCNTFWWKSYSKIYRWMKLLQQIVNYCSIKFK